jgi:hypothetical protein
LPARNVHLDAKHPRPPQQRKIVDIVERFT